MEPLLYIWECITLRKSNQALSFKKEPFQLKVRLLIHSDPVEELRVVLATRHPA